MLFLFIKTTTVNFFYIKINLLIDRKYSIKNCWNEFRCGILKPIVLNSLLYWNIVFLEIDKTTFFQIKERFFTVIWRLFESTIAITIDKENLKKLQYSDFLASMLGKVLVCCVEDSAFYHQKKSKQKYNFILYWTLKQFFIIVRM